VITRETRLDVRSDRFRACVDFVRADDESRRLAQTMAPKTRVIEATHGEG
jgi:hypothetical protein